MRAVTVRKWFELEGRDVRELEGRIGRFREAIRKRSGTILKIDWSSDAREGALRKATVLYEVPLAAKKAAVAASVTAAGTWCA